MATQEMITQEMMMGGMITPGARPGSGETISETRNNRITRPEMTSFLEEVQFIQPSAGEIGEDIPVSEVQNLATDQVIGNIAGSLGTPRILPTNPQFAAPNNPLLPPEYSEILDYNTIQYMNGIFRTQIGKYVKVNQLVGSNNIQEHDGFLIGVGINYIILQDYDSDNITFIDFYGIKNMYVYFEEVENPYTLE